ncbi:MAG: tandem-95 repeat protein, partial [Rubrobacteraceae bacterium]
MGVAYSVAPSEAEALVANAGGSSAGGSNGSPRSAVPPPPIARNDRFTVREDNALRVKARGVLRNDRGARLRAFKASGPNHGGLVLRRNGSLVYTPKKNFSGRDSFAYKAKDNRGRESRAVVTINVRPVNDAPVAKNDSYEVDEDAPLTVNAPGVLDNDTDVEGHSLDASVGEGPSNGALTAFGGDGSFTYQPDDDFNRSGGDDSFTYRANDGKANSQPATVGISVNPINDTPTVQNGSETMDEDGDPIEIDFGALADDVETADGNLEYDITSGPTNAQGTLSGTGSTRTFTPAENYNGTFNITFEVTDRGDPDDCGTPGAGCDAPETSDEGTVSVTVDAVNDPPTFEMGENQTVDEDSTGANDTDIRKHTTADFVTNVSPGPPDESGQTVTVAVSNVAVDTADNDDKPLFDAQPAIDANGDLTYTLAENAFGEATVTVRAEDDGPDDPPNDNDGEKTFTITVNPVNDAPSGTFEVSDPVDEGSNIELSLTNVTDPDPGDTHTYRFKCGDDAWSVFGANNTASCPTTDDGTLVVKGQIKDDSEEANATSPEYTETVTINNVAPNVSAAENQNSDEGENKSFDLGEFTDPGVDGPWNITVDWGDGSANDTFTVGNATDAFPSSSPGDLGNLEHEYDDDGTYTVTVTVAEEGTGTPPSDMDTFDVTVANLAPTADSKNVAIDEDDAGEKIELTASDPGNDPLTFGITNLPANGTLYEGDGTDPSDEISTATPENPADIAGAEVTYVPDADYFGGDSFDFRACDNGNPALCDDATVDITVNA